MLLKSNIYRQEVLVWIGIRHNSIALKFSEFLLPASKCPGQKGIDGSDEIRTRGPGF
jgi:hypothetical protein